MSAELSEKIDPDGLKVWRIHAIIFASIMLLVVLSIFVLTFILDLYSWIQYLAIGIWMISTYFGVYLFPKIRWNHWRYEVREEEIEIQSGIFVIEKTLVPMIRVQHVDTIQGPLLKRYNLAEMSISTAATVHTIPALKLDEADELRARISRLARVAEEDV